MIPLYVVSDFNAEFVSRYLAADRSEPFCTIITAPYGQPFQALMGDPPKGADTVAFVWTTPEGIVPEFARLIDGERVNGEQLLIGVDEFAAALKGLAERIRLVLVASWVSSRNGRGLGMLDWTANGQSFQLARMNLRLADALSRTRGIYLLDAQRWLDVAGNSARAPKYWFTIKCPFEEAVCRAAAKDIKASLCGAFGQARKLVAVDLDDTIWGGLVGDEGWEALRLGGHSPEGEAYVDFQRALKALTRRGIQVGLVSKNEEATALEAIDKHPSMVLRRTDIAGWRINWHDKAQNLVDLAQELNLGLESVVFIDDNPAEQARVREALPQVLVPAWPADPTKFADALRNLDCFEQAAITAEDQVRARMYVEERERKESTTKFASLEDWLRSAGIRVNAATVDNSNLKRAVQLLNKTNQMNLRSRRLSENEFLAWLANGKMRQAVALSVADRFGDLGLTGLLSWELEEGDLSIVDYVLSCRAMGRCVEDTMVYIAVEAARQLGARRVVARAAPNERNRPCLAFWRQSSLTEPERDQFVWDAAHPYPKPDFIALDIFH